MQGDEASEIWKKNLDIQKNVDRLHPSLTLR